MESFSNLSNPKETKTVRVVYKDNAKSDLDVIKAQWSPKLCLFEKIESLTKINDKKYDIYDRVLTFEAENFHSKES